MAAAMVVGAAGTLLVAAPAHAARIYPYVCNTTRAVEINASNEVQGYLWASVPATTRGGNCSLEVGDSGAGVRALQTTLNKCYSRTLSVDGAFGTATRTALSYAQSYEGLRPDGWFFNGYEGPLFKWAAQDYKGYWRCARIR